VTARRRPGRGSRRERSPWVDCGWRPERAFWCFLRTSLGWVHGFDPGRPR
jgi:hypothetical protein